MLGEAAWTSLLCSHTGLQDLHRSRCSGLFAFRIRIERDLLPLIFCLLSAGAGVAPDTGLVSHTFEGLNPPAALQSWLLSAGKRNRLGCKVEEHRAPSVFSSKMLLARTDRKLDGPGIAKQRYSVLGCSSGGGR